MAMGSSNSYPQVAGEVDDRKEEDKEESQQLRGDKTRYRSFSCFSLSVKGL